MSVQVNGSGETVVSTAIYRWVFEVSLRRTAFPGNGQLAETKSVDIEVTPYGGVAKKKSAILEEEDTKYRSWQKVWI